MTLISKYGILCYGTLDLLDDDVSGILKISESRWQIEECFQIMKTNDNDYYSMLQKERELSGKGELHFELELQMTTTEPFFSASSAQLPELIDQTGSIRTASSCMHISYTTARKTVNHIEQQLGRAVLERVNGGPEGGGSRLTGQGYQFLAAYREFHSRVQAAGERAFRELFGECFLS